MQGPRKGEERQRCQLVRDPSRACSTLIGHLRVSSRDFLLLQRRTSDVNAKPNRACASATEPRRSDSAIQARRPNPKSSKRNLLEDRHQHLDVYEEATKPSLWPPLALARSLAARPPQGYSHHLYGRRVSHTASCSAHCWHCPSVSPESPSGSRLGATSGSRYCEQCRRTRPLIPRRDTGRWQARL